MKHLMLLGAGHAHVHVLSQLSRMAQQGPLLYSVTLVAPYPRQLYSGMVPGFVAGHYALDDCAIALGAFLANSGVRWLQRSVTALDANAKRVTLDDGTVLDFDWLSINTGPVLDRQKIEEVMPGAGANALFVRPIEDFGASWQAIMDRDEGKPQRVAVIGGGAAGIELAMAIGHRLAGTSVTLVAGGKAVGANYTGKVQRRIDQALKKRDITVLLDKVVAIDADNIAMESGASLACDLPLLVTGADAPPWLIGSGLTLDERGFVAVDAYQRSTSHPQVFAAGDVSTRMDRKLARSGVYAVRAGTALAHNLSAALAGEPLREHQPPRNTLNLLSCGDHEAIASWGPFSAQGAWVWRLKDRIDRGFIRRYGGH